MRQSRSWLALLALDSCVPLSAIGGGIALVTGAEVSRYSPELLVATPFSSYLIPGLILTLVVGGSAAIAMLALLLRHRDGADISVLAGVILMGWIVGEVLLLPAAVRSWVEILYFALGLAMAALGIKLGQTEQKGVVKG